MVQGVGKRKCEQWQKSVTNPWTDCCFYLDSSKDYLKKNNARFSENVITFAKYLFSLSWIQSHYNVTIPRRDKWPFKHGLNMELLAYAVQRCIEDHAIIKKRNKNRNSWTVMSSTHPQFKVTSCWTACIECGVCIYTHTLILANILHFDCVTPLKSMSQPMELFPNMMVC